MTTFLTRLAVISFVSATIGLSIGCSGSSSDSGATPASPTTSAGATQPPGTSTPPTPDSVELIASYAGDYQMVFQQNIDGFAAGLVVISAEGVVTANVQTRLMQGTINDQGYFNILSSTSESPPTTRVLSGTVTGNVGDRRINDGYYQEDNSLWNQPKVAAWTARQCCG